MEALIAVVALAGFHVVDGSTVHGCAASSLLDVSTCAYPNGFRIAARSAKEGSRKDWRERPPPVCADWAHERSVARQPVVGRVLVEANDWRKRRGRARLRGVTVAMVLCAGFGTRLSPLTDALPKPLVPIGDRPLLAHIVQKLAASGLERVVLNVHHRADDFRRVLGELPLEAQLVYEDEIRGTAGGIAGARALLGPAPVLVHNGDILLNAPIRELLASVGSGLCLVVSPRPPGQGSVGLGAGGRVVRLRGRSLGHEVSGAEYVGVCAVGAECLASLPDRGCLVGDWAIPRLLSGEEIRSVSFDGPWTDAGNLAAYLTANRDWLRAQSESSYRGPEARVAAEVSLEASVVGAGARIDGSGLVQDCVLWPGAHARAPLSRRIVMSDGRQVPVPG